MKIKRFNNLWTMGLIIFGALLILFYALKIICPSFVVGVAEMPSIVKFGTFVDSHWCSYHLFNGITSFIVMFFYCGACCKTKRLDYIECCAIAFSIVMSIIIQEFFTNFFVYYNFMGYIFLPLFIAFKRKLNDFSIFYATCICFLVTTIAQCMSLEIRGIYSIVVYPNTATYLVLLIDLYIWNVLIYLFFNARKEK